MRVTRAVALASGCCGAAAAIETTSATRTGNATRGARLIDVVRVAPTAEGGAPRELRGDDDQQEPEEATQDVLGKRCGDLHACLDPHDGGDTDDEGGSEPQGAVSRVTPGPDTGRGHDREQRRRCGLDLPQAERHEQRHEENAAADPEQP